MWLLSKATTSFQPPIFYHTWGIGWKRRSRRSNYVRIVHVALLVSKNYRLVLEARREPEDSICHIDPLNINDVLVEMFEHFSLEDTRDRVSRWPILSRRLFVVWNYNTTVYLLLEECKIRSCRLPIENNSWWNMRSWRHGSHWADSTPFLASCFCPRPWSPP